MNVAKYLLISKVKRTKRALLIFLLFCFFQDCYAQSFEAKIIGYNGKAFLSNLSGEKTELLDSVAISDNGIYKFNLNNKNFHSGIYRLTFDNNKWIDFVNDGEDVSILTKADDVLNSIRIMESESNKLFYTFLKLNKAYKTKTELLQLILARYPKDDVYFDQTKQRINELQNEYIVFVNVTAQKNPQSFLAKYIHSAQLPVVDVSIQTEKQPGYLKAHALDNVDFNNSLLINSDLFTNKTIEYLTYFRNPQLPLELLEKEFMSAVDSILNKAKVNQLVYRQITEYLIEGFKKFSFDKVLDYIVENYVIKDDLCLDVKTEGLIKRRIDQAKNLKTGNAVPNIILPGINGKDVDLKSIDTEETLIVFYASWCPHCKELLPKLNVFAQGQPGKKIKVLAVSLDTKKEDWTSFVFSYCPGLVNVSDLKGWDGKAANDYFIYATPTMFLLDKDKKIIAKPVTVDELKTFL